MHVVAASNDGIGGRARLLQHPEREAVPMEPPLQPPSLMRSTLLAGGETTGVLNRRPVPECVRASPILSPSGVWQPDRSGSV
jgi:hypothetical protein